MLKWDTGKLPWLITALPSTPGAVPPDKQAANWTDSWVPLCCWTLYALTGGRGRGEQRDRGERGERDVEGQRERRRRKEKAGKPPGGPQWYSQHFLPFPPPFPPSLPPVSPAPRSPSAACACVPPRGRRSRSGSRRSSYPSRWRSHPSGPPPRRESPGNRGGAWTPPKTRSSRTPPGPRRWLLIGGQWRSWTEERWNLIPDLRKRAAGLVKHLTGNLIVSILCLNWSYKTEQVQ